MPEMSFRPARSMSLGQRLRYELVRHTFSTGYRLQFYDALRFLLGNGNPLGVALRMIAEVHTDFGRHWHPYGDLVDDCLESLSDNGAGRTLEDVLAAWGPLEEAALISAGMRSGKLPETLLQASKLVEARRRILTLVGKMSLYPLLLFCLGGGMLVINGAYLIPTLRKISDPKNWSGALGFMHLLANFTDKQGAAVVSAVAIMMGLVLWSIPRWRGRLRRIADNMVPWSVYQDIQGAVFLMNMAALLRANVQTLAALQILLPFSSPWLQERLGSIIARVEQGDHLGKALRNSGYQFPSKEAANYLSLLTEGDGAPDIIGRYGDRWLEQTLERVNKRAIVVMFFSLLLIFSFFLLILSTVMQIQDMTSDSMQ
ncbi:MULTISPECIES: type II secretion system F family protein [Yersinia]|uniref:type II secretion system F family protein n=1 Tax=Yersinia TaxID=629 RepID=UPI000B62A729|nr:type II secretion system F family protein [Yersinia kristensenii]MBW5814210.1 type II secretion system F family protein [Yersinia kristensenii]MBW5818247.1 type II secretion system F family protein [Yersinia kristensenii]MBW5844140.1 type II secretion system F family protein [Yersinia kristensenii]MDA5490216.1 type II secretion system F family protein [Yersinia kristensenii]OWF80795.1 pilus assembly protein PilR [Yersinia kristensenii]